MTKIDPRSGAPKNFPQAFDASPDAIPSHPGMHFVETLPDGSKAHAQGFSKTNFAHPVDDAKQIHAPTVEKKLAPVAAYPGQRSRTIPGGVDKNARLPGACCDD